MQLDLACLKKKIKYEPFWSLHDLVKFIKKKDNYKLIVEKLETESQMDDFFVLPLSLLHDLQHCDAVL